eukprot:COSAG02_NODE_5648_length_4153_cov_3.809571_2_plen_139_part_00
MCKLRSPFSLVLLALDPAAAGVIACSQVLRPIVHAPVIAEEIRTAEGIAEGQALYDISDMAAMVNLAAEQITDDRQNIYTILLALQRWCEDLELSVGEARKVALFCIVGDPERGLDPLEQFRCGTIQRHTRLCLGGTT